MSDSQFDFENIQFHPGQTPKHVLNDVRIILQDKVNSIDGVLNYISKSQDTSIDTEVLDWAIKSTDYLRHLVTAIEEYLAHQEATENDS